MKKLLAAGCCVIALQSFDKVNPSTEDSSDGKRILIKAIAGIVNNEANRKVPARQILVPNGKNPEV